MMKNVEELSNLTANSPKISGEGSSQISNRPFLMNTLRIWAMLLLLCLSVGQMWGGTKRIYFDYSNVNWWANDTKIKGGTGYVGCHAWNNIGNTDYEMYAVEGESNLAYCDIDDSYTSFLCFRGANLTPSGCWQQTANWATIGSNNRFPLSGTTGSWGDDNGKYLWNAGSRWAPGSTIDGLIDIHNPHNQAFSFNDPENVNLGTYSVTLAAHTTYQFKILEGTTAYGLDNNVFTANISNYASSSSGYAYRVATAGSGTYTFTWDKSTKKLTVTYPTVTHPNADYVYLYDHEWGFEKQYIHVWNSGSGIAETTWPGTKIPNTTTINGATYYYCTPGDYSNFKFSDGTHSNETGDLAQSGNLGKYYKSVNSSWGWHDFTFSVTLNTNEGTINAGNVTSYTFGTGATLPTNVTRPGYYFAGWYEESDFSGERVYSISTTDNTDKTYYAKWENEWTLVGDKWSSWDKDVNPFDNVTTGVEGYTCYIELNLVANTDYSFKLIKHGSNGSKQYYSLASYETMTYSGSHTTGIFASQSDSQKGSCKVISAGAGNYRFTLNYPDMTVTVTYPTSHTVTFGYGTGGSAVTATVEGDAAALAESGKYAAAGKDITFTQTAATGYTFAGWYDSSSGGSAISSMGINDHVLDDIAADATVYAQYTPNKYTISLDKNTGSGSEVPTSIKATYNSSSLTEPTPADKPITNAPWKTGYKFMGWYSGVGGTGDLIINSSGELVSGTDYTDESGNWTYTDGVTLYAKWDYRWAIAGNWDSYEEHLLTGVNTISSKTYGSAVLILDANSHYTFRVINRGYKAGDGSLNYRLSAAGSIEYNGDKTKKVASGGSYTYDIDLYTAGAGSYTFDYNITDGEITVTYPTSYIVTFGYGTGGSAITATVGDATTITSGQYAAAGKDITFTQTPATGYTFKGWYTTDDGNTEVTSMAIDDNVLENITADATVYAQYTENHYDVTATYGTGGSAATPASATSMGQITGGDITATAATGYTFSTWSVTSGSGSFGSATTASTKFYPTSASTVTASFTANGYTVTLNDDGGSDGSGSKSVTYNASTNLTSNVAVPTKSGYTFDGYYTSQSGAGSQLVDKNGAWIKSVASYTGASGDNPTWIYADNLTIYAKWTQTVILDTEDGTGSESVVVTYNSATLGSMTNPTKTGYTFGGYYTGDDGTDELVISTSQVLQASVTADEVNYTGAGGIWVYDGDAPTLYAKWTVKTYTVTLDKNGGTGSTPASVTATYGSGSLSASIPKPTKAGYYIAGWYTGDDKLIINADGALVSGISGYTDGAGNWIHDDDVILYAKWVLTWTLAGNKWNNWAKEDHIFEGVGTNASSKDTCYVDIDLDANTDYNFKIIKRDVGSTYWWHALAAWQNITYVTSKTTTTFTGQSGEDKGYSCTLSSAGAGTYRFILNLTDMTVTVVYPESYYVTMAMNPSMSINSSTISPESGYMSKDNGATITATPDYSHYFNGWTSSSGGTFDNASSAETTFKPTATTTVTAALPERTAFLQGRFQVRNSSGAPIKTKADGGWENNSTTIKMDYDAEKNRYFLHTYSTPAELMEQIDSYDPMFYIKTSTSTSSITDGASYAPASDADNSLDSAGEEVAVQKNNTRGTFLKGSVEANAILYFDGSKVWYELEQNTFTDASGDHKWSTASNWSADSVPGITDIVYIEKPVTVDIAHAKAKRIILDQNGNTGKLTIQANKGLEVLQTIKRTTDGSNRLATRAEDLILESSSSGNASLIFDNNNSDAATVQMYSKASISGDTWNWQFMGTPFTSANALYSYYGSYLYEWQSNGTWDAVANGGTMSPFTGYCITQSSATTYTMSGTLNPNDDVKIDIPASLEFVMANSWTAPIFVSGFTNTTLPLTDQNIYLFNTGHAESDASSGSAAGTYVAVPIHSAPYTGADLIAPMEGFYVDNRGHDAATITLKYNELVRPQVSRDIVAGAMHAPKRAVAAENEPAVMKIKATGSRYSERIVILAREDFSAGFDNGWDGKNINEPGVAPLLYALREDGTKDAVSAIPSFEGTVVGFRQGEDNAYTFSFEYDGGETLYLNDLKDQTSTLIDAEHTYSFTTVADDAEVRFIISATPIAKLPTGIGNDANDANDAMVKVRKLIINDQLFIIRAGRMYNAIGSIVK